MDSRPLVYRTKPPEPPGCLILDDLQTLHIPTNKKLEFWTQYRLLLSFLGGYFSSFKNILRQRGICKKILRNHRPTVHCTCYIHVCFYVCLERLLMCSHTHQEMMRICTQSVVTQCTSLECQLTVYMYIHVL